MKPIGPTIKKFVEESGIQKKEIADMLGISPSKLSSLFSKQTVYVDELEEYCIKLGIHPMSFFDMDEEGKTLNYSDIKDVKATTNIGNAAVNIGNGSTANKLLAEKELLIEEKNRLIEEKERTIQILMAAAGIKAGSDLGQ